MFTSEISNKDMLKELTILYVEDDEYAIEGLKSILSRKVKTIFTATNGQEGLESYKNFPVDIVLTDIRMPIMDGIEMVREIKKIDSNAKTIYISAHNEQEILMNAIDAGEDGFVIKPISVRTKLMFILNKIAKEIYKDKLLKKYHATLKLILDYVDSLIIVTNGHEMLESNSSFLEFVNSDSLDAFKNKYNCICECFISEDGFLQKEYEEDGITWIQIAMQDTNSKAKMLDKNGEERVFLVKPTLLSTDETIPTYVVNFTDITDIEKEREELYNQATKDTLTEILNRNSFEMFFAKELAHFKRTKEHFSIIFFDIDNFKSINDTYGHQEGDNVLRDISKLVSDRLRSSDIFARWGGEEFVVILPNTSLENTTTVADKLRESIESYDFSVDRRITCSFGIIEIDKDNEVCTEMDKIMQSVDEALYKAKTTGKNRIEIGHIEN
jgi:diguanylate cyclase (GGDEF)-like protein